MRIDVHVHMTKANEADAFRIAEPYEHVLTYLSSDLRAPQSIRDELATARAIVAGEAEPEDFDCNGYVAVIGHVTTRIECLYNDETFDVPTDVLIGILERWLEYRTAKVAEL